MRNALLRQVGVIGLTIAVASQCAEWIKGRYDAEAARAQNAAVLEENKEAVTRFERISYDLDIVLPLDEAPLKPYKDNLDKRVRKMVATALRPGDTFEGLTVVTKNRADWADDTRGECPAAKSILCNKND